MSGAFNVDRAHRPDPDRIATRQDFARELTALRERAGLTVRDVARAVQIRDSTAGGYFGGRHLPGPRSMPLLADIVRTCGVTDPDEVERWAQALVRVRRNPGPRPADEPVPYRGLATFEPEDERWFHGREALTRMLLDRVRGSRPGGPPLLVTGPSGSGKSSLLRAGLVPALRRERLADGTAAWDCRLLVPGDRPVHRLLTELGGRDGPAGPVPTVAEVEQAAARAVRQLRPAELVLIVDQFEAVFTACPDPAERQLAVAALVAVAARARVVLGLRGDFWAAAARQPALVPALQHHQVVVGPMTEDDLRRAITEPARLASLELEDGLAELILRDAATDAGALPLLSHALLATWRRGQRGRLTVMDYLGTGGIAGAIAQTAESIHQDLPADERELSRRMFLRLVHVDDDVADTRRRVAPDELLGDGPDAAAQEALLDRYVEQRLLTVDQDAVEIAHEALLSAWPRLRGWVDADRVGLGVHRQLTDAARVWQQADRDPNSLLRGGRLATVGEWANDPDHSVALNALEREFLAASAEAAVRERVSQRRRDRRLRTLLAAACALLLVSAGLTTYLFDQRRSADRQRDEAISRRVATDSDRLRDTDRNLSMQLALAAYRIAPTREARSALVDSSAVVAPTRLLAESGVVLQAVTVTPDGRTVAAGGAGGRVRLWDLSDLTRPRPLAESLTGSTGPAATVFAVVAAPAGGSLATGGSDGQVRLWDLAHPARPRQLAAVTGSTGELPTVFAIAYAPDGRTLAAGGADGLVRLWDVRDPATPRPLGAMRGPRGYVQALAFGPDGRVLAAGSADRRVYRWDLRRRVPLGRPLTGPAKAVLAVAFSPDGRRLAAGSADKAVHLWTAPGTARPVAEAPLTGATTWINAVAFSPDSGELAAGGSDNAVRLWRLGGARRSATTLPHPGPVTGVTYAAAGRILATSAADGAVRLWRLPGPVLADQADAIFSVQFTAGGRRLAVAGGSADNAVRLWDVTDPRAPAPAGPPILGPPGEQELTGAMAVGPDGGTIATGSTDGTVRLWHGSAPTVLQGPAGVIQSIAFSPDGRRVAASSNDHRVWLWQVDGGRRLAVLTGATNYVYGVAFDPTGRWLAAGSADYAVRLWDTSRPGAAPVATLRGPASYVFSVAFSPDGARLVAGSADNKVWLWNVRDPVHPSAEPPLTGPSNYVNGVLFNRSGRMLAAVSSDRTVWAWDTADPDRPPQLLLRLTGADDSVLVADFRPDGAWLAAGTADRTVRLWNLDPDQVAGFVCATAGDPITPQEWERYVTGAPYRPPCPR